MSLTQKRRPIPGRRFGLPGSVHDAIVPPRPGLKTVGFTYTFQWAAAPGSLQGHLVEVWREERRKADMVRVQRYYDQKIIATGAVYVWKSAVS